MLFCPKCKPGFLHVTDVIDKFHVVMECNACMASFLFDVRKHPGVLFVKNGKVIAKGGG